MERNLEVGKECICRRGDVIGSEDARFREQVS